ncbi:DUF1045 domain-containing protein [Aquabacterium sp. A7-Y]|uniref:DUF1045 domain-containing protein n=1 Tax=Aquabacterium sp. A7-Y TaxID=1349605 RepID=UPI00223D0373|nr:DUF1045 domain-containing protein [Aquabacterium sp. A7-Y]MCW7541329.1 DUF1045 domain-containing protein [Aquabacterium sp. A7-Y]
MTARHAVYWVPAADDPLWHAGIAWLGRDPTEGRPLGAAPPHRASPWRYGFHATLKAPMRWREGSDASAFADTLAALAREHRAVEMPALRVGWLRDFMALCPEAALPASFAALAADCVARLDPFRAPPDTGERARRVAGLDDEQVRLYDRWGYPHVFERWRMHLTLSDEISADQAALRDELTAAAERHFAEALAAPRPAGELAWFVEPSPGAPFRLVRRFPLGDGR